MVLERHWLSELWGDIDPELYASLLADIKANGIREPITLYEGRILDGSNRYRAGMEAGCDIPTEKLPKDEDPVAYVIRKNALRRSLTATQRAACVAQARTWMSAGRPGADMADEARARTNQQLADEAAVSVGTMRAVKKRVQEGHGEALATGDETLASLRDKDPPRPKKEPRKQPRAEPEPGQEPEQGGGEQADGGPLERCREENAGLRGELEAAKKRIARYRAKLQSLS